MMAPLISQESSQAFMDAISIGYVNFLRKTRKPSWMLLALATSIFSGKLTGILGCY
jgi:hypothetical protein